MDISRKQLAKALDHSLVFPTVTDDEVSKGCEIARRFDVATVTVKPCHIELAASLLRGSDVLVGTVVGFPHGIQTTETKVFETQDALKRGAEEVDMVMNYGLFLSGRHEDVEGDIAAVKRVLGANRVLKVILEVHYLNDEQIAQACQICERAGADFVKTATGFAPSGATPEIIRLMRQSVGPKVQVKAAHGVRSYEAVLAMLEAGASRCGVRVTEAIMMAWEAQYAGE